MGSLGFARGLRAVPFILMLVAFVRAPASAETPVQTAKRLYQAASHHYDLQEFEKALDEFKQAYEAKDDPVFLFNIAQCQRALGQNEPALRSYKTYLLRAPNAPNRTDVEARIAALETEIAQAKAAKPESVKPEVATTTPPSTTETTAATIDTSTPPANELVAAPPPRKKPVYKQWWLWTTVVVVGAGLGIGLGLGLTRSHAQPVGTLVNYN